MEEKDTPGTDAIKASDITVSFVCRHYPYKMVKHLKEERHLCTEEKEPGIYYIKGDVFPMQFIVTSRLSPEKNLWLSCLTNDLQQRDAMELLLREYGEHRNESLYQSAMDLIVRANRDKFEEGKYMCEALLELFRDDIEAARLEGRLESISAMVTDYLEEGFPPRRIMEKLEKLFGLTMDEAQGYLEKYAAAHPGD